ncbi:MAG: hypothetical protein ACREUA_02100 [Burkholderiales bacterium]
MDHNKLEVAFAFVDTRITELESMLAAGQDTELNELVTRAIELVKTLIIAYLADRDDRHVPDPAEDILEVLRALVSSDPSWNAIRDNCRELVYYRNCIAMNRTDALPVVPQRMTVRILRHVFLYIRTRGIRENRLQTP